MQIFDQQLAITPGISQQGLDRRERARIDLTALRHVARALAPATWVLKLTDLADVFGLVRTHCQPVCRVPCRECAVQLGARTLLRLRLPRSGAQCADCAATPLCVRE